MRHRRWAGPALIAAVLASNGCGVGPETTARPIPPPDSAAVLASPTPPLPATGPAIEKLFLVRDGMLVLVQRTRPADSTVDDVLHDLVAGPTRSEGDTGITSALLGTTIIAGVRRKANEATVELTTAPDDTGRTDDVLALGQIVCTLTSVAGVDTVVFTHDAVPAAVPRADASLSSGPLTFADYAQLVAPG